jgi:hypothetical protein
MVCAISAFLDFCYFVRQDVINQGTICNIKGALDRFHRERVIFIDAGIRTNFDLPRQHSLDHYIYHIQQFGAPNGLCSSITESKHIKAVKEPWRRSSHFNALGQILTTNQRLDKLAACRVDFMSRGMLNGPCPAAHFRPTDLPPPVENVTSANEGPGGNDNNDDGDEGDVDGPRVEASVTLARTPG